MSNPDVEIWQSSIQGKIGVLKFDRRGDLIHEIVPGGRKFSITTNERLINSDRTVDESKDPFKNGMLIPVRLLDTAEDAAEIAANPNLMTESDMLDLLKNKRGFQARLADITNRFALQRMLELAERDDVDASVRQVNAINARLEELDPSVVEVSSSTRGLSEDKPDLYQGKAVTPK